MSANGAAFIQPRAERSATLGRKAENKFEAGLTAANPGCKMHSVERS